MSSVLRHSYCFKVCKIRVYIYTHSWWSSPSRASAPICWQRNLADWKKNEGAQQNKFDSMFSRVVVKVKARQCHSRCKETAVHIVFVDLLWQVVTYIVLVLRTRYCLTCVGVNTLHDW